MSTFHRRAAQNGTPRARTALAHLARSAGYDPSAVSRKSFWAVAMRTVWDTTLDASEFQAAATTALGKADGVARVVPGAGGKTRWIVVASDARTVSRVDNALGLAG